MYLILDLTFILYENYLYGRPLFLANIRSETKACCFCDVLELLLISIQKSPFHHLFCTEKDCT